MNRAVIQFQCPIECSDVPVLSYVGCDYRYSDPVVSLHQVTYGGDEGYVNISWAPLPIPQYPPPSSNYFVMLFPQSNVITCGNTANMICLMTNGTVSSLTPTLPHFMLVPFAVSTSGTS